MPSSPLPPRCVLYAILQPTIRNIHPFIRHYHPLCGSQIRQISIAKYPSHDSKVQSSHNPSRIHDPIKGQIKLFSEEASRGIYCDVNAYYHIFLRSNTSSDFIAYCHHVSLFLYYHIHTHTIYVRYTFIAQYISH